MPLKIIIIFSCRLKEIYFPFSIVNIPSPLGCVNCPTNCTSCKQNGSLTITLNWHYPPIGSLSFKQINIQGVYWRLSQQLGDNLSKHSHSLWVLVFNAVKCCEKTHLLLTCILMPICIWSWMHSGGVHRWHLLRLIKHILTTAVF